MSGAETEFRDKDQEVQKLLEDCAELRFTLKTISSQLARIESRVKHAFPLAAKAVHLRKVSHRNPSVPSLTPQQALAEFDKAVSLVASGATDDAARQLSVRSAAELLVIAKELGVSFSKSKPSARTILEAVFGKVREAALLSSHKNRP